MQHFTVCPICPPDTPGRLNPMVPFNDSNIYPMTCPNGHRYIFVSQNQKFELLFELALYALDDGYHREAVTSAYVSLERYLEFYTRLLMYKKGISWEAIEAFWRPMAVQSERQLGAFFATYLQEHGVAAEPLDVKVPGTGLKLAEFRNKAIHQGHIPSREHAEAFCKFIFERIASLNKGLRGVDQFLLMDVGHLSMDRKLLQQNRDGEKLHVVSGPTPAALDFYMYPGSVQTFDQAIERSRSNREIIKRYADLSPNTNPEGQSG